MQNSVQASLVFRTDRFFIDKTSDQLSHFAKKVDSINPHK
jgi:hypothetical protein